MEIFGKGSYLILQKEVYAARPESAKVQFFNFDPHEHRLVVRDDLEARELYNSRLQSDMNLIPIPPVAI